MHQQLSSHSIRLPSAQGKAACLILESGVLQLLCPQVVAGRRFVGIMGLELVGNYAVRCVLCPQLGLCCAASGL
jgi:DUF971 family protein